MFIISTSLFNLIFYTGFILPIAHSCATKMLKIKFLRNEISTFRGGNASNSSTVLSELQGPDGHPVEYLGTLAEGTVELAAIEKDFQKHGEVFKWFIFISGLQNTRAFLCSVL